MLPLLALLLSPVILYYLYNLLDNLLVPKPIPGIPRLSTTQWFWGDARPLFASLSRTKQFHLFYEQLADQFEEGFFQFFWVASLKRPIVVISDPETIDRVLGTNADGGFDRAAATRRIFSTTMPFGALSTKTNKMWKHHRRLFGFAMSSKSLQGITPDLVKNVKTLLQLWDVKQSIVSSTSSPLTHDASPPKPEHCFEVALDLNFLAQDVISSIAFGQGYNLLPDTIKEVQKEGRRKDGSFPFQRNALPEASRAFFEALPATSVFPSLSFKLHRLLSSKFRASERILHAFLDKCVVEGRKRVRSGEAGTSLLDRVLEKELKEEQDGLGLLRIQELRDELCTFLVAGEETTATTMSWILRYLSQNSQVQHHLREEILKNLPHSSEREVSYEDMNLESTPCPYALHLYLDSLIAYADRLPLLPDLEAVLQESLRVSSTVVAVYRQTTKTVEIKARVVPAGHHVICLIGKYGRFTSSSVKGDEKGVVEGWDQSFDVNQFRPERWLDSDGKFNPKAGPNLPFSIGQRGCYGMKLASLELKLFIALLSQTFFLESVPDELADREETRVVEAGVTRKPDGGVWVRLRRW